MSEFVSIREASRITNYSPEYIRELLRSGAVRGKKTVTVWTVDIDDLKRHQQEQEVKRYP